MEQMRAVVVTVSDKGYAGQRTDESGPEMRRLLEAAGIQVVQTLILPDGRERLAREMCRLCDSGEIDLLLTCGGTGLSPRDVTPEATADVIDRAAPGIAEAMRARSMRATARAMLSRGVAGARGRVLIVNLPGSPRAVQECLEAVLPQLEHAVGLLRGNAQECARSAQESTQLSHLDGEGHARMVDVGEKLPTDRTATARAVVRMQPETLRTILAGEVSKGDVLSCARIAGIMAAKRTHELIPLCHPLPVTSVKIDLTASGSDCLRIDATVKCRWHTGVEMEALTAASIAGLTVYDMCKAIDRGMTMEQVSLLHKAGGHSGEYFAPDEKGTLAR